MCKEFSTGPNTCVEPIVNPEISLDQPKSMGRAAALDQSAGSPLHGPGTLWEKLFPGLVVNHGYGADRTVLRRLHDVLEGVRV